MSQARGLTAFRDRAEQDVGHLCDIWGESEVLAR
jgi:hypothetical protein